MTSETVQRTVECRLCHKEIVLRVPLDGYLKWTAGELIQNAMPSLSIADRELLISRTCDRCWDERFGGLDDDL